MKRSKRTVVNKPKCGPEGWAKRDGVCIVCKKRVKKFLRSKDGRSLEYRVRRVKIEVMP